LKKWIDERTVFYRCENCGWSEFIVPSPEQFVKWAEEQEKVVDEMTVPMTVQFNFCCRHCLMPMSIAKFPDEYIFY